MAETKKIIREKPNGLSLIWVDSGARTHDTRNHNPMLCQLSYNHHVAPNANKMFQRFKPEFPKAAAKVLLFFDMTKYFAKKMSRIFISAHFLNLC